MFAAKHSLRTVCYSRRQHSQSITSAGFLLIRNVSTLSENLSAVANRSMSSTPMMEAEAEEESRFALILGKPGGGKGTISGKILKVSRKHKTSAEKLWICYVFNSNDFFQIIAVVTSMFRSTILTCFFFNEHAFSKK